MQRQPTRFANVDTASDDVCLIAFTSGTTGEPKATMHFHRDVLAAADRKERVDHRSLAAQGIDRTQTKHKGPAILALEARDAALQPDAAKAWAALIDKAKRERLAALKGYQTERQKALDQAKGIGKDPARDKSRGLALTKTVPPKESDGWPRRRARTIGYVLGIPRILLKAG